mmetsp:Transcript_20379/g.48121  ORF Transcript_20379/g.48121 Transcript_20379/m.48121 type:complete len:232 (-) Transcript_20379:175-870(-)
MSRPQQLHGGDLLDGVLQQPSPGPVDAGPLHHLDGHVRADDLPHDGRRGTSRGHPGRPGGIVGGRPVVPLEEEAGPHAAIDGILQAALGPVGDVFDLLPGLRHRLLDGGVPSSASAGSCGQSPCSSGAAAAATGGTCPHAACLQVFPMNHPGQHLPPTGGRVDDEGIDAHAAADHRGRKVQRPDWRARFHHLLKPVARVRGRLFHGCHFDQDTKARSADVYPLFRSYRLSS